jgi:predicted nucleotidyltransferase
MPCAGIQSDRRVIKLLQEALPDILAVYVFGSTGTPYERAGSDLDLAFLSARPEDPVFVWDIAQRIAAAVGRDVDLIDLRRASTVIVAHIVAEGRRLLCADSGTCAAFETYALADYARLNEERRGILEDIRARGSVHG